MSSPGFSLTPAQRREQEKLAGAEKHHLIYGGSRSGKTFLFCRAIAVRAVKAPGSRHAIIRKHQADARQAVWGDTWPTVMRLCFPGVGRKPNKQDGYETLANRSEIWFGGLDDAERAEKILGKEYATIYLNEVSQISYASVLVARSRLAQTIDQADGEPLKLKAYYDLNPVGAAHWSYKEFVRGVNPVDGRNWSEGHTVGQINPRDNAANLRADYIASLEAMPAAERRRFFEGQFTASYDGALWTDGSILRADADQVPDLQRVVIGVDPSGASNKGDKRSDDIGIVVVGLGVDGIAYVLADCTMNGGPEQWAAEVVRAYNRYQADLVLGEANFGGDMVRAVIQTADPSVNYQAVTASRGKVVRAEPVAGLYDERTPRVRHAGRFPDLEEQMMAMTRAGYMGDGSPDRLDALVWALTELMIGSARAKPVKVRFG